MRVLFPGASWTIKRRTGGNLHIRGLFRVAVERAATWSTKTFSSTSELPSRHARRRTTKFGLTGRIRLTKKPDEMMSGSFWETTPRRAC